MRALVFPLVGMVVLGCGGSSRSPASPVVPSARSNAGSGPGGSEGRAASLDNYDSQVAKVKELAPQLGSGTAVVVRYRKEETGERLSVVYLSTSDPVWNDLANAYVVLVTAESDDEVISTMELQLPTLEAGDYSAGPDRPSAVLGSAVGVSTWQPDAAETCWSRNDQGRLELRLRRAPNGQDIEGLFRGRLVSNEGGQYLLVDDGYLYMKRPAP